MENIQIDSSFWVLFPDAQINVMTVSGLDNVYKNEEDYQQLLNHAEKQAQNYLTEDTFSDNPIIKSWRETYQSFKKKKGARSSIEALLKRVSQDKTVGTINPLVDIYNSISMSYGVPVGGEDTDTIHGTLHLGVAEGDEAFYPLGDDENEPALPGEVIYSDDEGAVCRCLNWRDGKRTMLTDETSNAVLFIEATNADQKERIDAAMNELQSLVEKYLGVTGTIHHLTKENPSI